MEQVKYIIKESEENIISFKGIVQMLKKRSTLFFATAAAVFFITVFFTFKTKPYYDTKIAVGSAYFSGNAIEPMITYLADLRNDGNFEALSQKLNISIDEAKSIQKIQIRNKTTQKDFFTADILLRVNNTAYIPKVSEGIMQFFESNPFVKNRVDVMKHELEDFTSKGEQELVRLDSLKTALKEVITKEKGGNGNIVFPSNIHLEGVMINEKVYQARQDLKLVKGVELLSQPAIPATPANPSKLLLLFSGIAAGLVLGVFVVLGVENLA
jgi:LPS O-antigen subunit length determinant protein (WzzB/FepE family)